LKYLVLVRDGLGVVAILADDVIGPDDAVLHLQEGREVGEGESEQGEEHLRRERHRELAREVALAAVDERVDPLVHQCRNRRLERGHVTGREQRVEDLAVLHVVGRVDLQRDERADGAHRQRRLRGGGREDLGLAEALLRRLPGGEDVAHAVEREHR
jgi:hypothetical protein